MIASNKLDENGAAEEDLMKGLRFPLLTI